MDQFDNVTTCIDFHFFLKVKKNQFFWIKFVPIHVEIDLEFHVSA